MSAFRKIFFWLHLAAGLVAGVIILVMCVTGVLLTFERQIVDWAERDLVTATPASERLPIETLLERVRAARPETPPTAVSWKADPATSVSVAFGREGNVFVQPYTGEILGSSTNGWRGFFRSVTDLHRWLAASEEKRALGKSITGAANLVFLFLVVSGVIIWWPRQWRASALRAITLFDGRLRGKARDWNWHNAFGFWCSVPLFFIVITGVLISYPWATDLLHRMTGSEPPSARSGPPGQRGGGKAPEWKLEGLNAIAASAGREIPNWQTMTLRLPAAKSATVLLEQSHRGRPDKKVTLTLDTATGAITQRELFSEQNTARQLRTWGRWVHTGEAGGWLGQSLAGLATLGGGILVWTGFALSWRRFFSRKIRSKSPPPKSEPVAVER